MGSNTIIQKSGVGSSLASLLGMLYGNKIVNKQSQDILQDAVGLDKAIKGMNQTQTDYLANNKDLAGLSADGSGGDDMYSKLSSLVPEAQSFQDTQNATKAIIEAKKIWEDPASTVEMRDSASVMANLHRGILEKSGIQGFGADQNLANASKNFETFSKQNRDNFINSGYQNSVNKSRQERDDIINRKPRQIFGGLPGKILGL